MRRSRNVFWQCRASGVTMAPQATPSSASSAWAAGISLAFSAMSTWASTSAVSVAKALSTCAAARSWNWSKLPRSVLPSSAMLPFPGVARRLQQGGMTAECRLHPGRIEPLEDVADGRVRGGSAPGQTEHRVQPAAVDRDEGDDAAIRVAVGYDGQDGEQQHVGQRVELALRPARIRNLRQQVQQRRERGHGNLRPVAASRVRHPLPRKAPLRSAASFHTNSG